MSGPRPTVPPRRRWSEIWTPPRRTPAQLRNARVRIIGSLLIFAALVVAVVLRLAT